MLWAVEGCKPKVVDNYLPEESELVNLTPEQELDHLSKIWPDNKDNEDLNHQMALIYLQIQRYNDCLKHTERCLKADPKKSEYIYLKLRCLANLELWSDAYETLALNELNLIENESTQVLKLEIYTQTAHKKEAERLLSRMSLSARREANVWQLELDLMMSNKDTLGAISYLENRQDSVWDNEKNRILMKLYKETARSQELYKLAQEYIQMDSAGAQGYSYKAVAMKALGKRDSAVWYHLQAWQRDTNHFESNYALAIHYLQKKKYSQALKHLQTVYRQQPDYPNLVFKLYICSLQLNDMDLAIQYFEKMDSSDLNYRFAKERLEKIKTR